MQLDKNKRNGQPQCAPALLNLDDLVSRNLRPLTVAAQKSSVPFCQSSAEQWFHPYLDISADDPKAPRLLFDWNAFTLALETNFGLADPVADAESAIKTVVMRDDDRIATYNVSFNKYATLLEWNDPPLRRAYWRSPSGKLFSAT
ncbi:hypothetical protein FRC20_004384 [Serendipita sp. 405]|nr:hypothetical protein FRC20_004384 [Serendipita sp. 405]